MAKDVGDMVRDAVGQVVREAAQNIGDGGGSKKSGPLSGMKGVAAGAGLASLAPLAVKGASKLVGNAGSVAGKAGSKAGDKMKESVSEKVDEAGGVKGIAKQAGQSILPGGGDGGGSKDGVEGVGKGRRMPVQQAVDVAVPIETAYNQWTQFEDWPTFMFRLDQITQEDDCTVSFKTKMWGFSREFTAEIETQRPDERIKWSVKEGLSHTGVVTFHELAPRLTRIEVNIDVDPSGLIEKAARGMRHVKRTIRADLHRFKAFIEIQELETGAWRGVIEDGELVDPHPEEYDEERDYSDVQDAVRSEGGDEDEAGEDEDQDQEEQDPDAKMKRFERQLRSSSGGGSRTGGNGGSSDDAPSKPSRPRKPAGRR